MLSAVGIRGFKSLFDTGRVELAPLTVLFGPNAAGKSNFLDAIQVLSRLASERTVADALGSPIRGLPIEAFSFPRGGLPGLLTAETASFALEAEIQTADLTYRYSAEVAVRPSSGVLTVTDEYLAELGRSGDERGRTVIERGDGHILVRPRGHPGRPRQIDVGQNYTQLSDLRLSGGQYGPIVRARAEMQSWRTYYLDPRVAMRSPQAPQEVNDIGPLGEYIAPYLYRLRNERPRDFDTVRRTLRTLVPSVEDLVVDLDPRRGVLDVEIRQDGMPFSSRVISEGTLRVLALVCVVTNPWGGTLIAFEEPENGVHPRRIELVAETLVSLARAQSRAVRQVIVTTHSPIFCDAVIRITRGQDDRVALYQVGREGKATTLRVLQSNGPLFTDSEIMEGLSSQTEDGMFEGLVRRGLLDG